MKNGYDKKDLKKKLTKDQYEVIVNRSTEYPNTGTLLNNNDDGVYRCAVCNTPLFVSDTKYDSTTPGLIGWPSFSDAIKDNVELTPDNTMGMSRLEVSCKTCGGHLGHLFEDPEAPGGQHYCINSVSLEFEPKE